MTAEGRSGTRKPPTARQKMQLTAELVALVERLEADPGPEPGCSDPCDADYDTLTSKLLAAYQPNPLWLFAYGSLIWNPAFEVMEKRHAVVAGWHRAFCMTLTRWRGTRDFPGLMLALDRGGSCSGLAYRLPDNDHAGQIRRLLVRELDHIPATNVPRWLTVRTEAGPVTALAFVAAPDGPAYAGRRSLEDVVLSVTGSGSDRVDLLDGERG